jgi:predicted RNA-binding Zn ribbon-like protein
MDVEPPISSGAPYFIWLGGRPALDFVNTVRERWRRSIDLLVTPDDLACWLRDSEILATAPAVTREALEAARGLRAAIDSCVDAAMAGRSATAAAVGAIDRWLPYARPNPRLELRGGAVRYLERLRPELEDGLGLIAQDAARLLGTAEVERVRVCAAPNCGVRFFDRSPAARRRWCSMSACGNVAKARRHRARAA